MHFHGLPFRKVDYGLDFSVTNYDLKFFTFPFGTILEMNLEMILGMIIEIFTPIFWSLKTSNSTKINT